jgi:hypothetical protein
MGPDPIDVYPQPGNKPFNLAGLTGLASDPPVDATSLAGTGSTALPAIADNAGPEHVLY